MKENLTIEQQIIDYLTYMKVMTRPYVLDRALKDQEYTKEIYTDELFNSITFASNSDIDGLFTVA